MCSSDLSIREIVKTCQLFGVIELYVNHVIVERPVLDLEPNIIEQPPVLTPAKSPAKEKDNNCNENAKEQSGKDKNQQ